jgi:hypothetical protein
LNQTNPQSPSESQDLTSIESVISSKNKEMGLHFLDTRVSDLPEWEMLSRMYQQLKCQQLKSLESLRNPILQPPTEREFLGYLFSRDEPPPYPAGEEKGLGFIPHLIGMDKDVHSLPFSKNELIYSCLDTIVPSDYNNFARDLLKNMPSNQTVGLSDLLIRAHEIYRKNFMPGKLSDGCCSAILIDKLKPSDLCHGTRDSIFLCIGLTSRGRFKLLSAVRSANPEDYLLWKRTFEELAARGLKNLPKVIGDSIGDVKAGLRTVHKGYDLYGVMPANVQKILSRLRRELTGLMSRKDVSRQVILPKSKKFGL